MNHFMDFKAKHILGFMLFILLFVVTSHSAIAVEQLQTKYFTIIYDEGGEFTAGEISKFCDDVYEKLMALYNSFTDDPRVLCIVNDAVDLATGYAIYFQNTITVYATNMDFELRGQTNWLKNVFVHEMTHMIALKKAAKGPVNFVSLGVGKYNDNPDLNVDVLFYHLSQPAWFTEGTAQVGAESFGSEHRDTHREMLLRSAWLENSLLSFEEMSTLLGKKSISGEMVYNQGYSMVRYIKEKYSYDKIIELNNTSGYFDFNPTIKRILGISARKLYNDWLASLDERYSSFKNRPFVEGEEIEDKGSADYYPVLSPDGRYIAWLSNRGKDYAITDLMLKDMSTGKTKVIVKNVDYRISWSHDSTKLIYVRRPERSPSFYDIYTYDVTTEKERRISKNMLARDPGFSTGDSLIVFVRNTGGNNTLAIINSDGASLRYLTSAHDGTQFYSPSFSPDGSKIVFGLYRQNLDRDISLKDYRKGEGSGFNWPLKYYIGGGNILYGYPYFAFWGSKIFYSRLGYTFPIRQHLAKDIMGVNLQSVYGNVFFEAGRTWNFRRISMDRLKEGTFKRDIGFELRCKMIAFYRLSVLAYSRIAWPLDGMGSSPYKNDARRFYFGLVM